MKPSRFQISGEDSSCDTSIRQELEAHVGDSSVREAEKYTPGVEVVWSITSQLLTQAKQVIKEAWQHSLLSQVEEK